MLEITDCASPLGDIRLAMSDGRLCALGFTDRWPGLERALERRLGRQELQRSTTTSDVVSRLRDYFAGDLAALEGLDVALTGTRFQLQVWTALRAIPVGETRTYGELARVVGAPTAVRAVGAANGANPVSIVVPCHRVIGADGTLTGYGGGIERKRWLLQHESGACPENRTLFSPPLRGASRPAAQRT